MAVTRDAVSTGTTHSTAVTALSATNLTIGGTASGLTYLALFSASVANATAHWDSTGTNQLMTKSVDHWDAASATKICIFTLSSPTTGLKTINITWSTSAEATIFGESWIGGNVFAAASTATGTGTVASVTIAAGSNNAAIAAHMNDSQNWSSLNQTTLFNDNGASAYVDAANAASSAGSTVQLSATSASASWHSAGIAIVVTQNPFYYQQYTAQVIPIREWREYRSWEWSYNRNLIGKDKMITGNSRLIYDLPVLPDRREYREYILPFDRRLHPSQDKMISGNSRIIYDLPILTDRREYREWIQRTLLVSPRPFVQSDWPLSPEFRQYRDWSQRFQLTTPRPFTQLDWPLSIDTRRLDQSWLLNLLETTLSAATPTNIYYKPLLVTPGHLGFLGMY